LVVAVSKDVGRASALALTMAVPARMAVRSQISPSTEGGQLIRGRQFSEHALSQMSERGVPPSAVEGTIQEGTELSDPIPGRTQYHISGGGRSLMNPGQPTGQQGVTVVVDTKSGRVITVMKRGSDYVVSGR